MDEPFEYPFEFDVNDGEIIWRGVLARPTLLDGGWGYRSITWFCATPVAPDFIRAFIEAGLDGIEAGLTAAFDRLNAET